PATYIYPPTIVYFTDLRYLLHYLVIVDSGLAERLQYDVGSGALQFDDNPGQVFVDRIKPCSCLHHVLARGEPGRDYSVVERLVLFILIRRFREGLPKVFGKGQKIVGLELRPYMVP